MSINPAAAAIGTQFVDVATRALGSGAAALPSLTGLAPAGAEEVSMQAAMAFAAAAEAMLALSTAAQEELARTGLAVTEITQMYSLVDGEAAGVMGASAAEAAALTFRSAAISASQLARGAGPSTVAGLMSAETLTGAAGSAARTPLMANLIDGVVASNPATTVPAAANAASTVLGAGTAPLSSIGQFTSMGGAAGGGAAAVPTSLTGEEESARDEPGDQEADGQQPGEQLV
jgi:hypothetical protein